MKNRRIGYLTKSLHSISAYLIKFGMKLKNIKTVVIIFSKTVKMSESYLVYSNFLKSILYFFKARF